MFDQMKFENPSAENAASQEPVQFWFQEADRNFRQWFFRLVAAMSAFYTFLNFIGGAPARGMICLCLTGTCAAALWILSPRCGLGGKALEQRILIIMALVPALIRANLMFQDDGPQYHAWTQTFEMTPEMIGAFVRHSRLLGAYQVFLPLAFIILRFRTCKIAPVGILVADAVASFLMQLYVLCASPSPHKFSKVTMAVSIFLMNGFFVAMSAIVSRELNKRDEGLVKLVSGFVVQIAELKEKQEESFAAVREPASPLKSKNFLEVYQQDVNCILDFEKDPPSVETLNDTATPPSDETLNDTVSTAEGGSASASGDAAPGSSEEGQEFACQETMDCEEELHRMSGFATASKEHAHSGTNLGEIIRKSNTSISRATPTRLQVFVENPLFMCVVSLVLVLNMVALALHADFGKAYDGSRGMSNPFFVADICFAIIYTGEIGLRLGAYRMGFFKCAWNDFELFLVVAGNLDVVMTQGLNPILMRSLRMLRLTRMVKLGRNLKELRIIMESVLRSLRVVAWSVALLLIINFSSAIFCTHAIGRSAWIETAEPEDKERLLELFDTVPRTMYTLFQVQTLEGWSDNVVRPILKYEPTLVLFFVPYVIFMTLCVLNVVAAVIVDSTAGGNAHDTEMEKIGQQREASRILVSELNELFEDLLEDPYTISKHEWVNALEHGPHGVESAAMTTITSVGLTSHQTLDMFEALDGDNSGRIEVEKFVSCLSRGVEGVKHIDVTCLRANMWQVNHTMKEDLMKDFSKMLEERDAKSEAKLEQRLEEAAQRRTSL